MPSHGEPQKEINALLEINKEKMMEIMATIRNLYDRLMMAEEVLQQLCAIYHISLNPTQYVLVFSTIRSFLTYLYEAGYLTGGGGGGLNNKGEIQRRVFMPKKSFNEKLNYAGDLPKVEFIDFDNKMAKRFGGGNMLIAAPIEYDEVMKRIPSGKIITSDEIRAYLAKKHHADFTCQLTAGIFINIAANASQEREDLGSKDITPYWRTLKKNGELNEKYPGGIDRQKILLEMEGHKVIRKGKRYFVEGYEKVLYQLQ